MRRYYYEQSVVFMNLTLDGVMAGAGTPGRGPRGGFEHGGWAIPYATMEAAEESKAYNGGPCMLGRRTYDDLLTPVWPNKPTTPSLLC